MLRASETLTESTPRRLLIVDDSPDFRLMLTALFGTSPHFIVIGEAENGREALRLVDDRHPDVVILDVRMPDMNGLEVLDELQRLSSPPVTIMLSGVGHLVSPEETLARGADAYFSKDLDPDELLDGIWEEVVRASTAQTRPRVPRPPDDVDRVRAVRSTNLLDSLPDAQFDTVTQLVAAAFNLPIALVTVIDAERQWVKSRVGDMDADVPRELAFCSYAILDPDEVMVVEDASADPRFARNPIVTHDPNIRFYAGAPVRAPNGQPIGTLCVLDSAPHQFESSQRQLLLRAAAQVEALVAAGAERDDALDEQHRMTRMHADLEQVVDARTAFLAVAQHKLKTPLSVIVGWTGTLQQRWDDLDSSERELGFDAITRSAAELRSHIDDLLDEARAQLLEQRIDLQPIALSAFVTRQLHDLQIDPATHPVEVSVSDDLVVLADGEALRQVLAHLLDNAVKYSPDGGSISLSAEPSDANVVLRVKDHGIGLPDDVNVFEPFQRGKRAAGVARGTGLGLYIVQSLIGKMHGVVVATNDPDGTAIEVVLPAG